MLKIVQYLIKSRPNSLSLGKSWEVALVSLVPQGFKIPLQSEDTALFQRDWDKSIHCIPSLLISRKTLPCSKGIETRFDICLSLAQLSEDTALFQRDWDSISWLAVDVIRSVGRHCPVPKGLRQNFFYLYAWFEMSEDTALFQRDWDF